MQVVSMSDKKDKKASVNQTDEGCGSISGKRRGRGRRNSYDSSNVNRPSSSRQTDKPSRGTETFSDIQTITSSTTATTSSTSQQKRISEVEYLNIQESPLSSEAAAVGTSATFVTPTTQTDRYLSELHSGESSLSASRLGSRSESTRRLVGNPEDTSGPLHGRLTSNLIWAVLASAVGSSFQHGYNGGVVNAPEKFISQFINDTYYARHAEQPSDTQVNFIFGLVVSIFCIGGLLGSLLSAFVADKIGRKEGLLYNNLLVLIACPLMSSARSFASYELLILGRLIIGLNAGLNAALAPLYLNEIAPINMRGSLGAVYQLVLALSLFISNMLGVPGLLGTQELWPFLFLVPLLPAALMLMSLPHCTESPKYLMLIRESELQAQQALAWFRGTADIQEEMEELRIERELSKSTPPVNFSEMVRQRSLRRPLILAVVIMFSQQISGINAILFFSTSIFRSSGLDEHSAVMATIGMSLVNVLMTILSLFLVDRAGRKILHMSGIVGMAVTCLILGVCLGGSDDTINVGLDKGSGILAIVSVYIFIAMFASGPGAVPWFLIAELFPADAKPLGTSIAVAFNWLANFLVALFFLPLTNVFHGHVFFMFAALLILFYLFIYYKVPETKGATAEEISALFRH